MLILFNTLETLECEMPWIELNRLNYFKSNQILFVTYTWLADVNASVASVAKCLWLCVCVGLFPPENAIHVVSDLCCVWTYGNMHSGNQTPPRTMLLTCGNGL